MLGGHAGMTLGELLHSWGFFVCEVNPNYMNDILTILGAIGDGTKYRLSGCGQVTEKLSVFLNQICPRLRVFANASGNQEMGENELVELLGEKSFIKEWLVASLERTIRMKGEKLVDRVVINTR